LGGGLALRLDLLGAFFLAVTGIVAIPAAVYGAGYSAAYQHRRASLRLLGMMFNLFLLTMSLVTLADNVLTFLMMWEGMSLTSYFLVMTEADDETTRNAGLWYVAMTHAGLAMLTASFLTLTAGAGSGTFSDLRGGAPSLSTATRNAVFTLALLGFGSKAGMVPLHVGSPARIRQRRAMSPR
jgi:hydrogenase-4 component B